MARGQRQRPAQRPATHGLSRFGLPGHRLGAAADWWFAKPSAETAPEPVAAPEPASVGAPPAPVRALAERLSKEGREALARIEAQLAALDRVELAKKSLEWHEAQTNGQPNGRPAGD